MTEKLKKKNIVLTLDYDTTSEKRPKLVGAGINSYMRPHDAKNFLKKQLTKFGGDINKIALIFRNGIREVGTLHKCSMHGGEKVISASNIDEEKDYMESLLLELDENISLETSALSSSVSAFTPVDESSSSFTTELESTKISDKTKVS